MPNDPNTYSCQFCQRTFTTKGSLHRHQRNHENNGSFECFICGVSFRRRDLLTRHASIHGSDGEASLNRQRTRTACETCRQARVKCSGNVPCDRCNKKDMICTIATSSARTSCKLPSEAICISNPSEDRVMEGRRGDLPMTPVTYHTQLEPVSATGTENDPLTSHGFDLADETLFTENQISPNSLAWPWVHEDLFLRDGLDLDGFDFRCDGEGVSVANAEVQGLHDLPNLDTRETSQDTHQNLQARLPVARMQEGAIDRLVTSACENFTERLPHARSKPAFYARLPEMAQDIATAFGIETTPLIDLQHHIDLYRYSFWPLWPLSPRYHFSQHVFEPVLYLAMASIGAMYDGRSSSSFGIALHNRLRDALIQPAMEIDLPDNLTLPLGQARSLTQAAALYFGHQRAFSYASHLGGALIIQARKTNLFATTHSTSARNSDGLARWVKSWVNQECRIRLSFAIMRLEMYTSALFMTRPLLSAHELDIPLPCSSYVWTTNFNDVEAFAAAIEQDRHTTHQPFSYADLFSILTEPEEDLPDFNVLHGEILINALQEEVWLASTSRHRLSRLRSSQTNNFDTGLTVSVDISKSDVPSKANHDLSLDAQLIPQMSMTTLVTQIRRTTSALRRVRQHALHYCSRHVAQMDVADRSSMLSCLLAYHLGFLQLHAPIASIQRACHHKSFQDSGEDRDHGLLEWSFTEQAMTARQHAIHIYHLLKAETKKVDNQRAKVNFLTMLGLYHSAAVLYVLNTYNQTQGAAKECPTTDDFVTIFGELNPAWAARSSFSNMLQTLR